MNAQYFSWHTRSILQQFRVSIKKKAICPTEKKLCFEYLLAETVSGHLEEGVQMYKLEDLNNRKCITVN
jgi:hypothetical protein